jgi:hypothetical protein
MLFPPLGYAYYGATVGAVLLTVLFFAINSPLRDEVNLAVKPATVPERLTRGYGQKEFSEFQAIARAKDIGGKGMNAIELYRHRILLLDIGFCVFCGLASYLLWGLVATAALSPGMLGLFANQAGAASIYTWMIPKLCFVGAVSSILYGVIDTSEDVTLIYLLGLQEPTVGQVQFASVITVTKIVTILCSGFGAALFGILGLIF